MAFLTNKFVTSFKRIYILKMFCIFFTFLQQIEAQALTVRTDRMPMRNVKIDESKKHHHFLSLEKILISQKIYLYDIWLCETSIIKTTMSR